MVPQESDLDAKIVETLLIQFMEFIAETQGLYFGREKSIIVGFINSIKRCGDIEYE